jgi:hypothetical protein
MKVNKYFLIYFIILINNIYTQTLRCSTNLECKDTGCCKDNKCSPKGDCRRRNKLCYAFVGVGAFVVLVVIVIYFIRKIKETKKHLEYLKNTDPGSLTRRQDNITNPNLISMVNPHTN